MKIEIQQLKKQVAQLTNKVEKLEKFSENFLNSIPPECRKGIEAGENYEQIGERLRKSLKDKKEVETKESAKDVAEQVKEESSTDENTEELSEPKNLSKLKGKAGK